MGTIDSQSVDIICSQNLKKKPKYGPSVRVNTSGNSVLNVALTGNLKMGITFIL